MLAYFRTNHAIPPFAKHAAKQSFAIALGIDGGSIEKRNTVIEGRRDERPRAILSRPEHRTKAAAPQAKRQRERESGTRDHHGAVEPWKC